MSVLKQNSKYAHQNSKVQERQTIYDEQSHSTWNYLYNKQLHNLQNKAIPIFLLCLKALKLPSTYVPTLYEVSKHLIKNTGWEIIEVNGLIDNKEFFTLLANKKFPSTTYIRSIEEVGISKDPDIFHELFGHVPMLMDLKHRHFVQKFGELGLRFNQTEQALLQRLYWYTYETGLINTTKGYRIFGGSLLSSIQESTHVFCDKVNKQSFDLVELLRTPYRADRVQDIYFILESVERFFALLDNEKLLHQALNKAYNLGEYPASFIIDGTKYESYNCCKFIIEN